MVLNLPSYWSEEVLTNQKFGVVLVGPVLRLTRPERPYSYSQQGYSTTAGHALFSPTMQWDLNSNGLNEFQDPRLKE